MRRYKHRVSWRRESHRRRPTIVMPPYEKLNMKSEVFVRMARGVVPYMYVLLLTRCCAAFGSGPWPTIEMTWLLRRAHYLEANGVLYCGIIYRNVSIIRQRNLQTVWVILLLQWRGIDGNHAHRRNLGERGGATSAAACADSKFTYKCCFVRDPAIS